MKLTNIYVLIGSLIATDAMAIDQAVLAKQVEAALNASPLSAEQKVQHAMGRLGFGPNPAIHGVGMKSFLRYRTDSLGQKMVDNAATNKALAGWVAANIARVGVVEPFADEAISEFPVTIPSPIGSFVLKPSTSVSEQANHWFTLVEMRKGEKDPAKYHEYSVAISRINGYSVHFEAQRALSRAILARYPLGEALHNFWTNHFNIMAPNVAGHHQQFGQYREGIRQYMTGSFSSLLKFTAHHPTMLIYLDNYRNFRPVSVARGINENYAREVMELHTFGEGPNLGTYVQADVFQAARILTGLTIRSQTRDNPTYSYFCFTCHDPGKKVLMGRTFGEGEAGQQAFFNFIASHPRTAKNIARKLVTRFAMEPGQANTYGEAQRVALENRLAAVFTKNAGNLMQVYATLFTAPEFWGTYAYKSKVKQPFEFVASAYRAAGVGSEIPLTQGVLNTAVAQVSWMGQPIHQYSFPTGYKDANSMWANTNGINLATTQAFTIAQQNQVSFRSKTGAILKAQALEKYFNVQNAMLAGSCYQNEHGRYSQPYCTHGLFLTESDPNFKNFCFYRYLPYPKIVTNATRAIASEVLDFEGSYPTSYATTSMLEVAMDSKYDKIGKLPQPVRTQLGLLLANPKFLRR